MKFDSAALSYIRHVMTEKNMSAAALANVSGISPSTLTRALNNPKHKFTLSTKTLEKIASFSNISPAPFFNGDSAIDDIARQMAAIEIQRVGR